MDESMRLSCISTDSIIQTLSKIKADCDELQVADACEATILILQELYLEGVGDLDGVRDLIADYNAQAKTYQAMHKKYEVASKPIRKDGVLHCPECNHRVGPNHSHCHWCGQKLGY